LKEKLPEFIGGRSKLRMSYKSTRFANNLLKGSLGTKFRERMERKMLGEILS